MKFFVSTLRQEGMNNRTSNFRKLVAVKYMSVDQYLFSVAGQMELNEINYNNYRQTLYTNPRTNLIKKIKASPEFFSYTVTRGQAVVHRRLNGYIQALKKMGDSAFKATGLPVNRPKLKGGPYDTQLGRSA